MTSFIINVNKKHARKSSYMLGLGCGMWLLCFILELCSNVFVLFNTLSAYITIVVNNFNSTLTIITDVNFGYIIYLQHIINTFSVFGIALYTYHILITPLFILV